MENVVNEVVEVVSENAETVVDTVNEATKSQKLNVEHSYKTNWVACIVEGAAIGFGVAVGKKVIDGAVNKVVAWATPRAEKRAEKKAAKKAAKEAKKAEKEAKKNGTVEDGDVEE